MKKILIFAGILLPLFLFGGCQTVEHKTESQFDQDLRGLYSKIQGFGSQTRVGFGEFEPLTEAEWEELMASIIDIIEENNFAEVIANSGYYQCEIPDFSGMDIYDILLWIEANGTPDFYDFFVSSEQSTASLTVNNIIASNNLLPNERIGAIIGLGLGMGNAMLENDDPAIQLQKDKASDCLKAYNRSAWWCGFWYGASLALGATAAVAAGIGTGGGAALGVGVLAYQISHDAYNDCISAAQFAYNVCMR